MHRLPTQFFFLFASLALSLTPMADTLDVCLVSGSWEYDSQQCLTLFETYVESNYDADCTLLQATERDNLPGLEALDTCDVALFFTRRLKIDGKQLARVKNYIESGKPVVAVRTASHGFQNWLECDKLVYGGNYHGHYGNKWTQTVKIMADSHPVLAGVREFQSPYSLYKTKPLADDTHVLLLSTIPNEAPEPSAWTREYKGARIFYTSLGGVSDFENASFRRMMANALFWTARRDIPQPPKPKVSPLKRETQQANLLFRTRVKGFKGLDRWEEVYFDKKWNTRETAVIICDMWDNHWCEGAEKRCEAIAQKMNPVVNACRDAGMLIVHAPSSTLGFYANTEPRERARQASKAEPPQEQQITAPPLPIDDSDGGCDSGQTVEYRAWTRQSRHIEIADRDVISANGREIYNVFQQYGIKNVVIMGVHTNMCILNRSFAIKQMTKWGFPCVLVRDLTDAMYDPDDKPYVSHEKGTQFVIEHIEKYWCPTTSSKELMDSLTETQ